MKISLYLTQTLEPNMKGRSGRTNGMVLAVFIGARSHTEAAADLVDMMRYDRCYPVTLEPNTNSISEEGWLLFYQPPQPGQNPGFTTDRWRSQGYKELHASVKFGETGDWLDDDREQVLRSRARELRGSASAIRGATK